MSCVPFTISFSRRRRRRKRVEEANKQTNKNNRLKILVAHTRRLVRSKAKKKNEIKELDDDECGYETSSMKSN